MLLCKRKGELNIAEGTLLDASTKLERQVGKLNRDMIFNYTYLSELYLKKKKYGLALKYAKSALQSINTSNLSVLERSTTPLLQIAEIHAKNNSLDSAKYILNELLAINGFQPFLNDEVTKYEIAVHEQWLSYIAFSKSLYLEDKLLGDDQEYIIGKIKTGINLIDKVRSKYFFEKSEQEFQNSSSKFFNWSLKKLSSLHEKSGNENLLPLIFECLEKSKSITINRNFIRYEVSKSESVPEEIIEREKSLIVAYENAFQKYENNISDDSLNTIYVDEMYTLQNSKDEFLDSLETEYPVYFSSRYDQQVTGFNTIRSIAEKENRSFVINHWADSLIYQFVITPISNNFSKLKTENIRSHIENVQNIVSQPSYSQNEIDFHRTKLDFINSSYAVYESLFGSNNYQLTFDITLISTGDLVQFPFDVLLTDKVEANTSYKAMPFFIKTHAINYLGSATQYVQLSKNKSYKSSTDYIGFAPSYSGMKISNDSLDQFRNAANLNPLLYNFEEVSKTNSLFNGVEYIGKKATVEEFSNINSQLGILHLAMHTTIDDGFPLDSHLNFTIDSTEEDSRLYAHEIAQMNLNHDLVVLSACETNTGKEVKGEGILGIARAFQIASCPNLIVSNWLIDDRSSSEIMYTFFKGIKANLSPSKSLRNAKLEFLENSSLVKSHPTYWAGFSYYGNPPLKTDWKSNPKVLSLGGIVLLLFILIPFLKKRKNNQLLAS